jgi:chromate reductase, NAD(P)H dehydrogenase (quinone)
VENVKSFLSESPAFSVRLFMLKSLLITGLIAATPLTAEIKILAFSGSTREDSMNKKLIQNAAEIARQMNVTVNIIDLRDYSMPFYDGDVEQKGLPENAKRLRKLMIESQAIIIASPEYNGSLSGVLKNALDWASRSEEGKPSREAFQGKKFAIMSASPGLGGGSRSLSHLQTVIQNVGGEVIGLQLTVPNAYTAFDNQGRLKDSALQEQLKKEILQLIAH